MTATTATMPISGARSASPHLDHGQTCGDAQETPAVVDLDGRQRKSDAHIACASVDLTPAHPLNGAHAPLGRGDLPPTIPSPEPIPEPSAASISDPDQPPGDAHCTTVGAGLLALAAASVDDIERTRIAMANRLRAMRDDHGLANAPEYHRAQLIHDALEAAEHQAILELKRTLRTHPLGAWVKATVGIGEKQGARLLAAIDDPYWNHAEDRPRRGPAELWAYCGYVPGQKRRKGVKSNWNAGAKMRARLCAESCIKQMHSPYRSVYDRARVTWAERDTSDLHKHQHALRCVAKAILRDLWIAGRDVS